jgi:hypothetical protein
MALGPNSILYSIFALKHSSPLPSVIPWLLADSAALREKQLLPMAGPVLPYSSSAFYEEMNLQVNMQNAMKQIEYWLPGATIWQLRD